jgi:predicted transposase YdaD
MTLQIDIMQNSFFRELFEEGRQEGRQEGQREGEARLLAQLFARRFGPFPDWATRRLTEADTALLETWSARLLSAATLEDIFHDTSIG